ncbi:hypothetical protein PVAND_005500 [Polypedilum vanderplanki]|uniref:Uncharacterized protein n=1 Tax=Polypedilum vanderplanki TaxID=319348 RepID=A0A9J6C064_POLVA|nr:hypothetical protein PVAND_005500 [Polypedilum vanderplanki]
MVNAPSTDKNKQSRPFMKNSKKYYKPHSNKTSVSSRQYFHQANVEDLITNESTTHGGSGVNSAIENSPQLATESTPAIAIVAPTARNPTTHSININHTCKTGSTILPQMAATIPTRTMHVQHHIHHIQPVQISTTTALSAGQLQATNAATQLTHQASPWPVVEPAFHFGPGFEIHQSYCPTHSHSDQHIVLFHLSPGVAVSFQIAGGHKIIQVLEIDEYELPSTAIIYICLLSLR